MKTRFFHKAHFHLAVLFNLLGESLKSNSTFNSEIVEIRHSRESNVREPVVFSRVAENNNYLARKEIQFEQAANRKLQAKVQDLGSKARKAEMDTKAEIG